MLALSVSIKNGVLLVSGTEAGDTITVDVVNDNLSVAINAAAFTVPQASAKSVKIVAGAGNDRVTITDNVAIPAAVYGGAGNDRLTGGKTPCQIFGEAGHDTISGGAGRDVISGGPDIDTVDYSARIENLKITLDGIANDGSLSAENGKGEEDNIMADVENVIGGSGNDLIIGSSGRNTLQGRRGDDTLKGMAGDDVLVGGPGADYLFGGAGDDLLLATDLTSGDRLDGGEGFDSASIDSVLGIRDFLIRVEDVISILET